MEHLSYLYLIKDNFHVGVDWKDVIDHGFPFFDGIPLIMFTCVIAPYRISYLGGLYGTFIYNLLLLLYKINSERTFFADTVDTYFDYYDVLPLISVILISMAIQILKIIIGTL